jgi:dTDP-4-amino-4,6-dideoxygalactose transaminase
MIQIYLSAPEIGENEILRVTQAMKSNWIAPLGPEVDLFEHDLAKICQTPQATVVSSGTAAIHLALQLLGISRGDRVIVQSFTFVASANPILYLGAEPIFIDSEPESWNMSPSYLRQALQKCRDQGKPAKAVIAVDLYGVPANYREIEPLCSEFNVPLIEDAAEALGSVYFGKPAGSFGAIGILSFNGNKIITTSGGGALLTKDKAHADKAKFLATQARDPAPHYQHSEVGFNYRMSNVLAAIGRAQLEELPRKVSTRQRNFSEYKKRLSVLGLEFPVETEGVVPNRWLTPILFPEIGFCANLPERLREHLLSFGIESRPLWKPLHLQPLFINSSYFGGKCSETLFNRGLCLPSGSGLTSEQIDFTIYQVKYFLEKYWHEPKQVV